MTSRKHLKFAADVGVSLGGDLFNLALLPLQITIIKPIVRGGPVLAYFILFLHPGGNFTP